MGETDQIVYIVDDDQQARDALKNIAESVGLRTVAVESAEQFFERYDETRLGCLLADVRMPGTSGIDLLGVIAERAIDLPAILISGYADVPMVIRAVKAGAFDFLEKPVRAQDLLDRIHAAFRLHAKRRSTRDQTRENANRYESLTAREREVFRLMVAGQSGKQIASELQISYKTVEKFRGRVMKKMGATSIAQLVMIAISLGILEPPGPEHVSSS